MSKPLYYNSTLLFLSFVFFVCTAQKRNNSKTYIVHVTKPDQHINIDDLKTYHESFLPCSKTTTTSDDDGPLLIYSYKHVISGFAAKLTPQEHEHVKTKPGFISAIEEGISRPHTTHSPDFLGLHYGQDGFWKSSNYGEGTIIGVLDSGILPNHPSFDDKGMPPPPKKWKGKCEFGFKTSSLYHCNNKLIGAQYFGVDPNRTLIDYIGHGTHTASTAAGNFVANASVLGNGPGTAAGMAPRAHLAIYKVCTSVCGDGDILAAFDAAIGDGVDVISVSLGNVKRSPFYKDAIALGSFAAVQKGVLVSCSSGNSGPTGKTLSNEAPWILTVGASTMDRSIKATAKLGDGQEFDGESASDFPSSATQYPLVFAPRGFCTMELLEGVDVKDKIVLCDREKSAGGEAVLKNKSASGMILGNNEPRGFTIFAEIHVLPATEVSFMARQKIKAYINSTKNPTATIAFKGTVVGDPMAPVLAFFSSRGPSTRSPGILKPDIIGPGVDVLAAWPLSLEIQDPLHPKLEPTFNFLSGTSMSCPHLSGIAALLKSAHPNWSPAAIKSAIMTTADIVNLKGEPIVDQTLQPADVYGSGSGHVNPSRANDPGLVYDITIDDYIPYLCGLKYTEEDVGIIVHKKVNCTTKIREGDLNYPTFAVELGPKGSTTYARTVTNVGLASSTYSVKVVEPLGVEVSVVPEKLEFKGLNEKLSYNVTFTRNNENVSEVFTQGYLEWASGKYVVRSVIVATFA